MQFDKNFVLALFTGEVGSVGLQTVTLLGKYHIT